MTSPSLSNVCVSMAMPSHSSHAGLSFRQSSILWLYISQWVQKPFALLFARRSFFDDDDCLPFEAFVKCAVKAPLGLASWLQRCSSSATCERMFLIVSSMGFSVVR